MRIRNYNINQYEYEAGMIAFRIVVSTKTTDYPDGHAPKAWKRLKAKFQPDIGAELTRILDLKEGQDPEIFITKLE
jgi:hypothetical protein